MEEHTYRRSENRADAERLVRMELIVGTIEQTLLSHIGDDKADRVLILDRLGQIELRISKWHGGVVATGVLVSAIWAAVGMVLMVLTWRFPV